MDDTSISGGEELSIDQAAAAYAKTLTTEAVPADQADAGDETEGTEAEETPEGETEAEPAADDQADEAGDGEPESDLGRFVADNAKVRLPDGSVTTIAELKSGSLRNADYTRKTQEVAEQRRAVDSQSERIRATEAQLQQQAEYVTNLVRSIIPAQPDFSLADPRSPNYDPVKFQELDVAHRQWAQHLSYLESQQQQASQARQAETQQQQSERANREWNALLDKAPEFRDEAKSKAFVEDVRKHGSEFYGFNPQELGQIGLDHRQALVMRDAIAWRKLQAAKPKVQQKVEGRPPVVRGGNRLSSGQQNARRADDAFARLKQERSVEAAAAAYLATRK